MSSFSPSEIYQFAVKIEENGEKFYRTMADKLNNPQIKELFTFLADEEVEHKAIFKNMLAKFETYDPPESYPGEYFDYLEAYAENLVFTFKKFDGDILEINDIETALRFAIEKELDTIQYFQEMQNLVHESEMKKIEAIIEEERRHVVKLFKMQRELNE